MLLAISYCLMFSSRWFFTTLLSSVGFISINLFWSFKLFFIVMTGMMRYSSMGKLAAISTCPTSYDENSSYDSYYLSDTRTYADDATLISDLWIFTMVVFVLHCAYVAFLCCYKTHEDEDKEEALIEDDDKDDGSNLISVAPGINDASKPPSDFD